jgi:alkylated DNA repair protein alkB family protein 8
LSVCSSVRLSIDLFVLQMMSPGLAAVAAQRLAAGGKASSTGMGLAPAAAADVFVCDALQLCYRHGSCDAVLCIAVLHHISSRQRRLALLQQLADVLRCGGRGIVTVWATEQEDPTKTIQRWHRIQPATSQGCQQQEEHDSQQRGLAHAAAAGQQQASKGVDGQADTQQQQQAGGVVEGPDYFVPWHLPFHKAGGLAAAAQKQAAGAVSNADGSSSTGSGGSKAGASQGPSKVAVDTAKGAVVFQRFYHLFEQGELEGLIAEVPGLRGEQVFYDRSNWCVEFAKQA